MSSEGTDIRVAAGRGRGIQVAVRMSPDHRRMEVSGSRPNGGLQVAAGWRSPGRRRMEVSRSWPNRGLQVAAEWRSLCHCRSADHCGKEEVFVAKGDGIQIAAR